jgi:poly(hydroxyalkanoate) depolymerase family esterase
MRKQLHTGMAEATRLTRAGQLSEATALIQRVLGGIDTPGAGDSPAGHGGGDVVEGEWWPAEGGAYSAARAPEGQAGGAHLPALPLPRDTQPPPAARPAGAVGQFVAGSYANQAGTRSYKLYVPGGYQGQALPLIVMLHGCTQNPDDFAAGTRMNALAEEQGFFVAYPAQASAANASGCWNWFRQADQQRDRGEPSLIAGITRQIGGDYPIESRKVYVAGLSAGGAMAVIMGMTYPELFAAVGCHSGLAYGLAHDLPSALAAMRNGKAAPAGKPSLGPGMRPCPLIVFHGDRDTTVHPRNAERLIAQWAALHTGGEQGQAAAKPRVSVQQGQAPAGQSYTRAVYHDARGQAVAERWLIHGAGHAWSGGSAAGSFTNPNGPDATREMLRFFTAQTS